MEQRLIRVKTLMSSTTAVIKTDVRTLGEFKKLPEVQALGIKWDSSKLLDFASKASYEENDAVLPAIDCILLNTPTKSKSGANWSNASCLECKCEINKLKKSGVEIPFNYTIQKTEVLQDFLNKYYASKITSKSVTSTNGNINASARLVDDIIVRLNNVISDLNTIKSIVIPVEEKAVLKVTEKELDEAIKKYSK